MKRKMFFLGLTLLESTNCYWAQGKSLSGLFLNLLVSTLVSLLFASFSWKPSSRSKESPILMQTSPIIKIKFSYCLWGIRREAQMSWGQRVCQEGSRVQCLVGWRQSPSQCSAIGSTCGKGGDPCGKSKRPMSAAAPKRGATQADVPSTKSREKPSHATSHVDMSRARSLRKDREISCKWACGRRESRNSTDVIQLFLLKMSVLKTAHVSLSAVTHHEVCSLWKKINSRDAMAHLCLVSVI